MLLAAAEWRCASSSPPLTKGTCDRRARTRSHLPIRPFIKNTQVVFYIVSVHMTWSPEPALDTYPWSDVTDIYAA